MIIFFFIQSETSWIILYNILRKRFFEEFYWSYHQINHFILKLKTTALSTLPKRKTFFYMTWYRSNEKNSQPFRFFNNTLRNIIICHNWNQCLIVKPTDNTFHWIWGERKNGPIDRRRSCHVSVSDMVHYFRDPTRPELNVIWPDPTRGWKFFIDPTRPEI